MSLPYVCAFMVMIALLVPTVVAYIVITGLLIRTIKTQYAPQFHAMGSPSLWTVNERPGQLTFAAWLLKRDYRVLRDAEIERRGNRARTILLVMLMLQAIAVICAVLALACVFIERR